MIETITRLSALNVLVSRPNCVAPMMLVTTRADRIMPMVAADASSAALMNSGIKVTVMP